MTVIPWFFLDCSCWDILPSSVQVQKVEADKVHLYTVMSQNGTYYIEGVADLYVLNAK